MIGNWIKCTTTTSGTGNLTLSSVTGFDTFASQFGDATTNTPGREFTYVIQDGNNWETGIGHMSNTTTMVRDLIQAVLSSGTLTRYGTALTLSGGTCTVFCADTGDANSYPYMHNASSTTYGVPPVRCGFNANATASNNTTFSNGNVVFQPFFLNFSGIYSGITWHCQAISTATKFKWAIYDVSTTGTPNNPVLVTADITPATGDHNTSFTGSAYLRRGAYWIAGQTDVTQTWFTGQPYDQMVGFDSGGLADANGNPCYRAYIAQAYGAFPSAPSLTYDATSFCLMVFSLTRSA